MAFELIDDFDRKMINRLYGLNECSKFNKQIGSKFYIVANTLDDGWVFFQRLTKCKYELLLPSKKGAFNAFSVTYTLTNDAAIMYKLSGELNA